jgi:hypothetical protein
MRENEKRLTAEDAEGCAEDAEASMNAFVLCVLCASLCALRGESVAIRYFFRRYSAVIMCCQLPSSARTWDVSSR